MRKIRVLIVDDSIVIRKLLTDALSVEPTIEVVGFAANGRIALEKLPQLTPDLMMLDVEMPGMDGLETLAALRKLSPKLSVIMLSTLTQREASATLEALALGASDYMTKPANVGSVSTGIQRIREELIPKIKALCDKIIGVEKPVTILQSPASTSVRNGPMTSFQPSPVTFTAKPGSLTALIGPSGSGKSTLLRVIAGLDSYDSGSVTNSHGNVGMVFQQPSLWPHLTLRENVTLPLQVIKGLPYAQAHTIAEEVLNAWGLKDRLDAYPPELSGGQQQRGALARTLVMKPKVLCLDEITSALDPEITADILTRLIELKREGDTILLLATHHLGFAREGADQIIFMDKGKIIEQGQASQLLSNPNHPRTQTFVAAARLT